MSETAIDAAQEGRTSPHGVALGLVFVFVSTLLEVGLSDLPLSLSGFFTAQVSQPLLWIVDSAPLILGIFGAMVGRREKALREAKLDVAAEREISAELGAAKDAAESASRIKSEFLANMSHEIRTPMNGVLGMTNLMLETELSGQQRQFVEAIDGSAQTLLSIINDLLDFSKIETGKLALRRAPFLLSETLATPIKAMASSAAEKGLELVYEEDETLPRRLVGDQGRVAQVFLNLIDNAVKFTQEGEVIVRLSLEKLSEGDATIVLTVRDTGIGVDDETKDRIFEAFSQGDGSHTRRFGGTGLGLTISSRLTALMGGRLTVDSVVGEGSEFRAELTLPLAPDTYVEATSGLAGKRVLVVDDSPTSRQTMAGYLERWSVVAIPVESATAALETARVMRAAGRPIDFVLADLKMPYPEDLPLFERLEKEPEFGRLKVIAILSGRCAEQAKVIPEEWMAAHLDKPVFPEELAATLVACVETREEREEESASTDSAATDPDSAGRVLVAEDDRVNQMLAVGLLEKRGYVATIASDGSEAVRMVEREDFDFVLMDVQMPVMDGLEATKRIRALEEGRLARVPIIAVTAHSMKGDRERCLEAGMDDYVSKPIDPIRLYEAIDRRFPGSPLEFEPGRALDLAAGDKEILASAAQAFLEEAPRRLEAIHDALEHHDADALAKTAHMLEGRADRMAMPRLRDIAHRIAVLSARGDFEESAALTAELDAAVGSGASAIKRSLGAA